MIIVKISRAYGPKGDLAGSKKHENQVYVGLTNDL